MVERENRGPPISQQCRLLAVSRSSVYRKPAEVSAADLAIMALIDRHYLARPYNGLQIPTKSPADSEMMSPGDTR